MIKPLLLLTVISAFPLSAQQSCDPQQQNKVDYMQCLDQQLQQTRRELTSWENNHLFKLEEQASSTGRKDGLKLFNKARQSFELYTEHDCRWQFVGQLPDSNSAGVSYKQCQLYHLKQRIEFLKHVNATSD